jgi:predicted nucleic acid-binding protein
MIVLDTNVVSEVMKGIPDPTVHDWYRKTPRANLFVTTISEAEILAGIAVLPAGRRRSELVSLAIETFEKSFADRIFSFDSRSASHYADIVSARRRIGRPINPLDAQIAAIAREKGMAIATRNTRDFLKCGIDLIDPWAA